MALFNQAIDLVIKAEGGFSNHPADNDGGGTNYGITQYTLNNYIKDLGLEAGLLTVRSLTLAQAREIYRVYYWVPTNLDHVYSQKKAVLILDQAVNCGIIPAVVRVQKVINYAARGQLKVDGMLGPKTLTALNDTINDQLFCMEYIKKSQIHYCRLVKKYPERIVFLEGWLKRTHKLLDIAFDLR